VHKLEPLDVRPWKTLWGLDLYAAVASATLVTTVVLYNALVLEPATA
jgi:hypothetical protein